MSEVKPVLEAAAQAFADANAKPPFLYQLPPEEGRKIVIGVQTDPPPILPDVDISDFTIEGGPTGTVRVRIVRPPNVSGPLPVILYVHGLGWVFGGPQTHDRLVRELALGVGAAVVFPDYDLAPEHKYPTQIEQVYAVADWISMNGPEQGLDTERIAVAGDSVGGNMATVTTILAKQRGRRWRDDPLRGATGHRHPFRAGGQGPAAQVRGHRTAAGDRARVARRGSLGAGAHHRCQRR
jgi:acetyl esterase